MWYSTATNWKASFYKADGFNQVAWSGRLLTKLHKDVHLGFHKEGGRRDRDFPQKFENYDDIIGSTATVGYTTQ